jgi:hypothetical protein
MTSRPSVPTLTERELWLMEKAWECSRLWRDTATATTWLATSSWDGVGYEQQCAESAPQTPAPALLTAAQVADLADALELSEYSGATGDDVQRLSDAVHAVIPFTTLNIQTAARWLLAAHARVAA